MMVFAGFMFINKYNWPYCGHYTELSFVINQLILIVFELNQGPLAHRYVFHMFLFVDFTQTDLGQ